ncbi:acyltransferase [Parabacteroides pacaensis]|uniref:acyltransferase n=1 Tax=Parabacteroides pacaensis TaxID=2086575 RepID=UPI000D10F729|nr:acyltransferase [Parabacteroides pacaensis]
MELKKRENIGWVDLLRILACFLVVFSHCCDPFVAQFNNDRHSFVTGVFCGSLVRPCVPLFVMMTGVLLFPVYRGLGAFYKKRIGRIIVPLIFWSVALPLMFLAYMNFIPATNSPSLDQANYTLENAWNKIYTFVFNFNYDTTPLWYLYMLLGLYFIIPIFSSWMEQASKRELKLFLFVWGISLVLPYIKMVAPLVGYTGNYGNKGILGVCDWNDYGTFYYVSGFIGYLVLARYLVKYPLTWNWKKTLIITIPMFLAGYAITALGFLLTQKYFPGNYASLEIIWYFAGINVFMMTFPVFVIVQKLPVRSSAFLSGLASLTFGIYLSHFVFVQMGYDFFDAYCPLPVLLRIIGMACFTFIISAALVWGMKQFKLTRRLVM